MTEEETIAWLSRPRAPILRDGALSRDEVAEAGTAYLGNGLDLFEEALLLCAHKKVPRAAALVVLGLEEIAKVPQIINTFLRFERGVVEKDAWTAYWKTGGYHKAKQALILAYGQILRKEFDGDPVHDRRLYRYYAPTKILETLDAFKQSNFYVDLRQDGIHAPASDEENRAAALDYLLTFGQERADSFCAWHISARRSVDYLELALGRRPVARWTTHYSLPEVRADILYQVAALSASHVPDYMAFCSFAQRYRKKVSEKYFKGSLLSLATLLKDRVERSASLPLYYARYLNAFKLVLYLTKEEKIIGARFSKKLRETLLSHGPVRSA